MGHILIFILGLSDIILVIYHLQFTFGGILLSF